MDYIRTPHVYGKYKPVSVWKQGLRLGVNALINCTCEYNCRDLTCVHGKVT